MSALTPKIAGAYSKVRSKFFAGVTAKLLKEDPETRAFQDVGTVTEWFFEYSDYRKNFLLEIAEDSEVLAAWVMDATHVSIGTDVYIISQSDTLPPRGTDFTWKLFCTRYFNRSQVRAVY